MIDSVASRFAFTPVALAARRNGWTPERQRRFVSALANCGCVKLAASAAGISARSAYRLRDRPDAAEFAAAWDAAQAEGQSRIGEVALDRVIHGERIPVFYGGRQIGVQTVYNDRLIIALLDRQRAKLDALNSSTHRNRSTEFSRDVL